MPNRSVPVDELNTGTALVLPEAGGDAIIKHLKRPALLFKKIAVFHLPGFKALLSKSRTEANPQLEAELEWLVDKGLVLPFETGFFVDHFQEAAEHFPKIPRLTSAMHGEWDVPEAIEQASAMSYGQAPWLNLLKWIGADGVLVSNRQPHFLEPTEQHARSEAQAMVLNIVLDAFPEPNDDTPWEQIIEFRSDPDTSGQVLALKRWMSKVAQQTTTAAEISQEIEWLIHEYQAHMSLHRMKINTGSLETIVTAAGETIEGIVKLKFGTLAKSLFSLKQRRIRLIEAERQAPGRELAYIITARAAFGRPDSR